MQKERIGIIYCIKNKINGKKYIGKTCNEKIRMRGHKQYLKNNYQTPLYRAINKYGKENFGYKILFKIKGTDEVLNKYLNMMEVFYIKKYDSYNNGYNLTYGGEGTAGTKSIRRKKVINVITKVVYDYVNDAAAVINMNKDTLKCKLNGKERNDTDYVYLDNYEKGIINTNKTDSKKIINVNTKEIYDSALVLAKLLNINYNTLKAKLNNRLKNDTDYIRLDDYNNGIINIQKESTPKPIEVKIIKPKIKIENIYKRICKVKKRIDKEYKRQQQREEKDKLKYVKNYELYDILNNTTHYFNTLNDACKYIKIKRNLKGNIHTISNKFYEKKINYNYILKKIS
jgi:group I intron endonuclease